MRVLILGGAGMLGHKLWQLYRKCFDTWVTLRTGYREYAAADLFDPARTLAGVDAFDFDTVVRAFATARPDVVINAIGIIKQLPRANDPIVSVTINSLFPHRLANLCQAARARLIHISTDCVFSGSKGMYTENDASDATDLYGRTKFLGETDSAGCLTIRTSLIGRELNTTNGLVEWFLSNRTGKVRGYKRAIFTGFTTQAVAAIIAGILQNHADLAGVYQVSSDPIDKYELLCMLRDAFGLQIEIERDSDVQIDRSLDSTRFRTATGFQPPSWSQMIQEMANDPTPYDTIRRNYVS